MLGAMRVARRKKSQPLFVWKTGFRLLFPLAVMTIVGYLITYFFAINVLRFFVIALPLNLLMVYFSLRPIKKIAKGLTVDDAGISEV